MSSQQSWPVKFHGSNDDNEHKSDSPERTSVSNNTISTVKGFSMERMDSQSGESCERHDLPASEGVGSNGGFDRVEMVNTTTSFDEQSSYDIMQYPKHIASTSRASAKTARLTNRNYTYSSRVFLVISVVSATLILGLEAFIFAAISTHRDKFTSDSKFTEMAIFLALFIFAALYQLLITVIGLYSKNMLLLSMLCVFYACMLVYTGIQYKEVSDSLKLVQTGTWKHAVTATNIATIAVLATTFVSQVLLIHFALWKNVRWFQFKKIGASLEIKRLYSIFQIHRSFLIFDCFFFLGFTVQFIVIMIANKTSTEFILTCCMLPLTVVVLLASDFASVRELVALSIMTTCCFIAGCVYVLFKTVRLFTRYTSAYDVAMKPGDYFPGRTSLVTFAVITLTFLFLTICLEGLIMYGYNRGLLPYVQTSYGLNKVSKKGIEEADDTWSEAEKASIMID